MFGPGEVLSPIAVTTSLILGPIPPDTDGDRLSDYDEVNTHFTDPSKADTDGDGLGDYAEIRTYRTSPTNPDTDGDGYVDNFEIRSGKSPLNPLDAPVANLTIHPAVEIRVLTKLGKRYRVQTSKDLQVWTDSETVIEGNGQIVTEVFETAEGGVKYWRMREED